VLPTALGTAPRVVAPAIARAGATDGVARRRELEIGLTTVVLMALLANGPAVAVIAVVVLVAAGLGSLQVLGAVEGPYAERGVAVESLILPALTARGAVGVVRLIAVGPAILVAVVLTGILLDRALLIEARLIASPQSPSGDDRARISITTLLVALSAFGGIAALVPGGLASVEVPGAPAVALPLGNLLVLAIADAAAAGLLGYRAAALRVPRARDALWAALSYAVVIAIGAAAVRAIGIPRLVGPALLMFLFYLWDTLHAAPPSRRRDPRWIWETAALTALGVAVVAWNLRLPA